MKRRVVVTGAGCVTPLGSDVDVVWQRLIRGESGVGPITIFDPSGFPVRIAAEVRDWDMTEVGEDPERWRHHPRQTQFAVAAALKAARSAGLPGARVEPLRMGVYFGCGEIFPDFAPACRATAAAVADEQFQLGRFVDEARRGCPVDEDLLLEPGSAAGYVAGLVGAWGPNANFTAACVSSTKAIGEATEAIRRDEADVMLTGGAHSMIHPFGITGFHRLSTLSTRNEEPARAARPFDRERDGFVVGEGAAVLVLEELEHARRRGAEIWGEVSGWGCTHDAYRITDLDPEARAAAQSIRLALQDAELTTADIDYINAHGSGTVINDKVETLAIKKAFGERAYRIPISGTKSMTGHLTTACGAMEALVSLMALRHGVVPPTINYQTPDPDCDLDYVPNVAREVSCRHVLKNSFGFGGQNVTLVISHYAA
jgi:3-oxoacyl-[acyl-carrier-protein] synthase II